MNRLLVPLLLLFPFYLTAQKANTRIKTVYVGFTYSKNIFPGSWREAPINAKGLPIDAGEIQRSKTVIARALSKYPEVIFKYNLKYVYFLKAMTFYDVDFGGTNSTDAVYLCQRSSRLLA